jgi:hypothetical protein
MKTLQKIVLLLFAVVLVTGCARPDYGQLVRSEEATRAFETATVLPDHTYYYTGPEARPEAIMALDNAYTLANERNFWIKVDISEDRLQMWNRIIRNETRIKFPYYGSRIVTPEGKVAGVWYSRYDHTVIKTPEPQNIIVYVPDIPVERRFHLDRFGERSPF